VSGLADEFRSVLLLVCVEGFSYQRVRGHPGCPHRHRHEPPGPGPRRLGETLRKRAGRRLPKAELRVER
jgi:DNA-directed RNA polymerase specialized sigma24 family protein